MPDVKRDAEGRRPRNAAATREAILQSALIAFTRAGYEGVGVREIAGEAGVTAMLVNRYFGSKEKLFSAAVEAAFEDRWLPLEYREGLSKKAAERLATHALSAERVNVFMLTLRSAPNPQAAIILREGITRHFQSLLAETIGGDAAEERAALFLSTICGFQFMRDVLGNRALAEADELRLARHLERMFDVLVKAE
jgi:AcrR family transcriptional regulator